MSRVGPIEGPLFQLPSRVCRATFMPPPLVDDLSPALRAILKGRTESTLLSLIKKNKDTRYFSESPVFLDFHTALQNLRKEGDSEDRDDALIESYYSAIPLTTYDSYEPFVKRFLESNCLEKDVQNMFAPGLPHGIAKTSSTSSAKAKYIALYSYKPVTAPPKLTSGKIYRPFSFKYHQLIGVQNDKGDTIKKFPVAAVSAIKARVRQGLDVDQDHLNIKLPSTYLSLVLFEVITQCRRSVYLSKCRRIYHQVPIIHVNAYTLCPGRT